MLRALSLGWVVMVLATIFVFGCGTDGGDSAAPASVSPAPQVDPGTSRYGGAVPPAAVAMPLPQEGIGPGQGGDKYAFIEENDFRTVKDAPLSTFSIDVDTASYAKTRANLLEHHALPPPDAVRIEELINYFEYDYAGPADKHPFAVHVETAGCPWQSQHRLVRFGIQGRRMERERPASNLVFLIDVSGSMNEPKKLPLVQRALTMLVRQLGEKDRVAIVVYAGAAGLVLPPTSGSDQAAILTAIAGLRAGGSTNGGQGIQMAYQQAQANFVKGGVNRVLLCTDGDFNVGVTSPGELVRLAAEKAKVGVYLSVLGFGFGNHNDALLEELSNKANGNYAFLDSDREASKVLVQQMQGTLVTIAKDVKIQVEFNPAQVTAYRLIGYENRKLADRDFNDDAKDAGDIGAGHSVTALYEIVPAGAASDLGRPEVDPLKYRPANLADIEKPASPSDPAVASELLTLKLRYQQPEGRKSTLMTIPVQDRGASFATSSGDFQFATAVATFGMLLRDSKFKGDATYASILETASAARGHDRHGLRSEFLRLVTAAQALSDERIGSTPGLPANRLTPRVFEPAANHLAVPYRPDGAAPLLRFRPEQIFSLGLAIGALISIATLVACVRWLGLRDRRYLSFQAPTLPKEERGR
jgi:Ca-activated chloride channel homolog